MELYVVICVENNGHFHPKSLTLFSQNAGLYCTPVGYNKLVTGGKLLEVKVVSVVNYEA